MSEPLTRFEAQRRLIDIGMPAEVAVDYLNDDPPFTARSALSLVYRGAWPILEAYRRHCASEAAGESSTPVLDPIPAEDIVSSERNQVTKMPLVTKPKIVGWAGLRAPFAGLSPEMRARAHVLAWDPVTKAIAERLARDTETEVDPATGDKRPIGLSTNVDALRSVIADKAAQSTDDVIGQALTVASGAQAVESLAAAPGQIGPGQTPTGRSLPPDMCSCGVHVGEHESYPIDERCDLGADPYGSKRASAETPRADAGLPPALIPAEEWQRIEATAKSASDAAYSDVLASEAGAYLYARQKSPQYCACGATVTPGESHPTGAGHDVSMPESLTYEEAEKRLRAAGCSPEDIRGFLDPATARQWIKDPPWGPGVPATPILSAYVRGLNAKPEHTRIAGYMSRQEGVDESDFVYTARRGGVTTRREHAAVLPLADAFEAMRATVPDVRIVAVAEDGTETPCMNYQEALGTLLAARDAIRAELQPAQGQKVSRTSPLAGVRRGALLELLRMLGGL